MKLLAGTLCFFLGALSAFAQFPYVTTDLDVQQPNYQHAIDGGFSGDSPYFDFNIKDGSSAYAGVADWLVWTMHIAYDRSATEGTLVLTGTVSSAVISFTDTAQVLLPPYQTYYWWVNATSNDLDRTFGRGAIEKLRDVMD